MSPDQEIKLLIPGDEIMDNFCYAYCKRLVGKLKELIREDRAFVNGNDEAKKNKDMNSNLTGIAHMIVATLVEQTNAYAGDENPAGIDKLISDVEEFLAIFEVKQPPAGA
jgi:hypothetical protein